MNPIDKFIDEKVSSDPNVHYYQVTLLDDGREMLEVWYHSIDDAPSTPVGLVEEQQPRSSIIKYYHNQPKFEDILDYLHRHQIGYTYNPDGYVFVPFVEGYNDLVKFASDNAYVWSIVPSNIFAPSYIKIALDRGNNIG